MYVIYETTAETFYPLGESFSLGLVLSVSSVVDFIFNTSLTLALSYDTDNTDTFTLVEYVFTAQFVVTSFFTIVGVYNFFKSSFTLSRHNADCCIKEAPEEEFYYLGQFNENEDQDF